MVDDDDGDDGDDDGDDDDDDGEDDSGTVWERCVDDLG